MCLQPISFRSHAPRTHTHTHITQMREEELLAERPTTLNRVCGDCESSRQHRTYRCTLDKGRHGPHAGMLEYSLPTHTQTHAPSSVKTSQLVSFFMGMVNSITRAFHQAIHTHVVCWYWYPRSFCFVHVIVQEERTLFVTIPLLPSQCGPRVKLITSSSFTSGKKDGCAAWVDVELRLFSPHAAVCRRSVHCARRRVSIQQWTRSRRFAISCERSSLWHAPAPATQSINSADSGRKDIGKYGQHCGRGEHGFRGHAHLVQTDGSPCRQLD